MNADQHVFSDAAGGPARTRGFVDRIVKHLVERAADSRVETWPFQHFYLENLFPDDIYQQIVAKLPDKASYLPFNAKRWKNSQGEPTRDRLCLTEGELGRIDDVRRPFWADVTAALTADALRHTVYAKLASDIAIRLGC